MKTKADPTGQGKRRKRATRIVINRINEVERQVKFLFRQIPRSRHRKTKIKNRMSTTDVYNYDIAPRELDQLENDIQFLLNEQLLETQREMVAGWYWEDEIEPPYRQGTIEETNIINQMIIAAGIVGAIIAGFPVAAIPPEQVLLSEAYKNGLTSQLSNNFTTFKGLSERITTQIMHVIRSGVQSGITPTEISEQITGRFDVGRSSAERIARTEINKAYNDGKLETGQIVADRVGLRAGVIHISALTSTTRAHHAARHGNAYTTEDQLQWWNEGANRINCLCTTQSVLIDNNGRVVDQKFQEEIKAERKFFD